MARKYKYLYTNDYLQFITWNYKRTVNIGNPKIYEKLTDEQRMNIEQVKAITGIDITLENTKYFKTLPNDAAEKRKAQYFDILTGKKLESLFNVAKGQYTNVLMLYSLDLSLRFERLVKLLHKEDYAAFFNKLPPARDMYIARGYAFNKRDSAKRAMGEENMAINATRVDMALEEYEKKYNIR